MPRRALVLVVLGSSVSQYPAGASAAEPGPPAKCFRMNEAGQLPTCTSTGGGWRVSYDDVGLGPDFGGPDPGIPGAFGAFFVLALLVGVGTFLWRVSLARRVAAERGLNPNRATELTILGEHGLEAAYLAAHLRDRVDEEGEEAVAEVVRTVEVRLRELQGLKESGLVTQEEYDARRTAILDSL